MDGGPAVYTPFSDELFIYKHSMDGKKDSYIKSLNLNIFMGEIETLCDNHVDKHSTIELLLIDGIGAHSLKVYAGKL